MQQRTQHLARRGAAAAVEAFIFLFSAVSVAALLVVVAA